MQPCEAQKGASAALLKLASVGRFTFVATVPLCIEYESVCSRLEHRQAAGLEPEDVTVFLDALMDRIEPTNVWFLWRPQLRDPGDELVLEVAVNGRAEAIVTFNQRHFTGAAARFGIEVLLPAEVIRRAR